MALVLDRLWLDAARSELQNTAEMVALAAAGRLADDERINTQSEPQLLTTSAREVAAAVAGNNRCAGIPVVLDSEPGGDLDFGKFDLNLDNGLNEFLATELFPTVVRCRIEKSRSVGNPVARLFAGLTGESGGDAIGQAEATLTNLIAGFRPFAGGPVPAFPMAIWERDPSDERDDTWEVQIAQGAGSDDWRFDSTLRQVVPGADGLPELVLIPMPPGGEPTDANFQLINVGNGLDDAHLVRQIESGWAVEDLVPFGGQIGLTNGPLQLECSAQAFPAGLDACSRMIGQKRIVALYETLQPTGNGLGEITVTQFVAIRIMSVDGTPEAPRITVQPTVVTTRTALPLMGVLASDASAELANPYIYKVSLTK